MMLVLVVLIMRTVAIEFRSKEQNPRWRSLWDTVSFCPHWALLCCWVAFGNIMAGIPLDENQNISASAEPAFSFCFTGRRDDYFYAGFAWRYLSDDEN